MLLALFICGCSTQPRTRFERVSSNATTFTPYTQSEMLAETFKDIPLDFTMPLPDAVYGWERAREFFTRFGGGVELQSRGKEFTYLARKPGSPASAYEVSRTETDGGLRFTVRCSFSGPIAMASQDKEMRCRNLARFIRSGAIEEQLVR